MKKEQTFSKYAQKWYYSLRVILFLAFFATVGWVVVKTVFPNGGGYFDFRSYGSGKNTIADPRFMNGNSVPKGMLKKNEQMVFNASSSGDFTTADVVFRGNVSDAKNIGTISLVQAYRAYLYPTGDSVVCPREGTLISWEEKYGIVSGGVLRFFLSEQDVLRRGYDGQQFLKLTSSECSKGEMISVQEKTFPGMLLVTDEGYFQLGENEWIPFVSERAFLSRYRAEDALAMASEVFSLYPVSEARTGFADGTVVSYGDSAYAVSGKELRPIDNPDTFLAKGYIWEDILAMTGEEFGVYVRGKLYTKLEPHPNGTIFLEKDSGKMFLVEEGKKREIWGEELQRQFSRVRALSASSANLGQCALKSGWLSFECSLSWATSQRAIGSEYQFLYDGVSPVQFRDATVTFVREKNRENWNRFVGEVMEKLRTRYPFL